MIYEPLTKEKGKITLLGNFPDTDIFVKSDVISAKNFLKKELMLLEKSDCLNSHEINLIFELIDGAFNIEK